MHVIKRLDLAVIALVLAPTTALAGGLFVPGVGTQAMGRAGAFTAKADDPSALHHNPAGFGKHEGTSILLGMNLLDFSLSFQREGVYEDPPGGEAVDYAGDPYPLVENEARPALGFGSYQALPLFAVSTDFGLKVKGLRFGLGMIAPNAYPERNFVPEYDFTRDEADPSAPPPPQRYDVVKQVAAVVMPSIAVSYSIMDELDVGVRGSWGIAEIEASTHTWGLPNFSEWSQLDGLFTAEASDNFVPGYGVGVLYRPLPAVELGFAYASAMTIDAKGTGTALLGSENRLGDQQERIVPSFDVRCAPGGTPDALSACVSFSLPRSATLGGRYVFRDGAGRERGDIELDVKWEDWSGSTDQIVKVDGQGEVIGLRLEDVVIRHGFRDVLSVRLGGAYAVPLGDNALVVRAGVAHDTAAAPDSFQRLDIDGAARTTLAGGLAYQTSRFRVELAAGAVVEPDRTAPACNPAGSSDGCPEGTGDDPVSQREQPDPIQPIALPAAQQESPFNGGEYSSGYVMFSLGVTVML